MRKKVVADIDVNAVTGTDVLSLDDAKTWLRVTNDSEDALITSLIQVAVNAVQKFTGQYLDEISCTYRMSAFFDTYLPAAPLRSVSAVQYTPDSTPIDFEDYYIEIHGTSPFIHFNSPPAIDTKNVLPVTITAAIGYPQVLGSAAPPSELLHAVRLLLSHYYDIRENVIVGTIVSPPIPMGIQSLMSPYRNLYFV